MARTVDVDCPSGLSVTLREFTVADEDLLANPKSQRKGVAVTDLLQAITSRVNDAGPYDVSADGDGAPTLNWGDVLQGDRMAILLANRIFTWGKHLEFRHNCPQCRQPLATEIDLEELEVKALPETSRSHVLSPKDHPLKVKLPHCGVTVSFRLLRGKDDRALQKLQKQHKDALSSAYLRFRVTDIEGTPQPDWAKWLRNLGGADSSYLRAAFDMADCGVDQEIEFECEFCDHIWIDDVRFRADFLFPKHRPKPQTRT